MYVCMYIMYIHFYRNKLAKASIYVTYNFVKYDYAIFRKWYIVICTDCIECCKYL